MTGNLTLPTVFAIAILVKKNDKKPIGARKKLSKMGKENAER